MIEPWDWDLINTKVRQERCAQENLEGQDYTCFLPQTRAERLCRRAQLVVREPLFTRYLFIPVA